MTKEVTTPNDEYSLDLPAVTRNRVAYRGQTHVKRGGTTYLKPLGSMLDKDGNLSLTGQKAFDKYLSLALYFNAVGRTVDGLTGLVFRKHPQIELTPNLEYLAANVDATKATLRTQMQKTVINAFLSKRSGLLVDFPDVQGDISRKEAEKRNLRPKVISYPFESIINWDFDTVNNEQRLVMLVLKEVVRERPNRFTVEHKNHYRALELRPAMMTLEDGTVQPTEDSYYHHSLYDEGGVEIQPPTMIMVNGEPTQEIPFYFIEDPSNKAPVDDLVDVSMNHYNMFASYANKEHMSGFPIYYETGVVDPENDKNIEVGPGAKWVTQSDTANFGVLETSGDGGSLRQYLEDRKLEMASLGAEMLNPQKMAAEAAESKRLDQQAQNSVTANVANSVSEAYENAVKFAAMWMGDNPDDIVIKLNTDYVPSNMTPQMLTALTAALQAGHISYETFYENLQKGEIANPKRSAEEEKTISEAQEVGL